MRKLLSLLFLVKLTMCSSGLFAQTAEIYQKAGDGYLDDKNYQAAYDSYNQAIKKSGHDKANLSVLYYKRGESLKGLNKTDDAIKDYNNAIELNPQYSDAYWGRGVVYDDSQQYQLAINDYKKAISLMNSNYQSSGLAILYCNVAFNELGLMNYTEALQADSVSLSLREQYSRAYKARGEIHNAQKKYDLAVDDYTQSIFTLKDEDTIELSFLFSARADNKRFLKKYKEAINDYSLAIHLYSKNKFAYWNRGATYHHNGDFKLAADDYTTAMTYYQGNNAELSKLYYDRATNELGQNLLTDAIQDDSTAITLNPDNKDAMFSKAFAYTKGGNYQAGIDEYNKLIALSADQKKILALLYYQVANGEYFLNEFDKVIADCSKAIELNPAFSASYYYRGKVYLKKMNNKQLAITDFNKVIELDTTKKTVNYIFSKFYSGETDEAVAILQNEILTTTQSDELLTDYYNMACLYSLMNKPDEANTYLQKAIDSGYSKKYAAADEDLDNIRNTADYKSMMSAPTNP